MSVKITCDRCGSLHETHDSRKLVSTVRLCVATYFPESQVQADGAIRNESFRDDEEYDLCGQCRVDVEEFIAKRIERRLS